MKERAKSGEDKKKIAVCRWQLKMKAVKQEATKWVFHRWRMAVGKVSSHVGAAEWAEDHGPNELLIQ